MKNKNEYLINNFKLNYYLFILIKKIFSFTL